MKVESLYDKIYFVPQRCETFTVEVEGVDGLSKENNIVTKAFYALNRATGDLDILDFFYRHKVVIEKNIPLQAGLGGGSSNAGTFLRMVNRVCNLKLSLDQLAKIGAEVGADVPFFVYGFDSANVSGFGEIVEPFDEERIDLKIFTPPLVCDTKSVYQKYRADNIDRVADLEGFRDWPKMESLKILNSVKEPSTLNDLYKPAIKLYPKLLCYQKENYYFSGSGSSFFTQV
jgi:4-diphosphocytidyl-2-C-methyl-D-erythritol kinase